MRKERRRWNGEDEKIGQIEISRRRWILNSGYGILFAG
jgi:hypothetical protein